MRPSPPLAAAVVWLLAMSGVAEATTGLAWQWDGPRRYQIVADVQLPSAMQFNAEKNRNVRVAEFVVAANITCEVAEAAGRDAWEIHCAFDDVTLQAAPVPADAGLLLPVLEEMSAKYEDGAYAQLILSRDGKLKSFDLEGVNKRNQRIRQIHEVMRLLMARAFAAFDLNLPKDGDDHDRPWRQTTTQALAFPSTQGTIGGSQIDSMVSQVVDGQANIKSVGRGVVGPGGGIGSQRGGSTRIADKFDTTFQSAARFDTATGTLTARRYQTVGTPTASSVSAEGGAGITYMQTVRLAYVAEGTEAPELGVNEEAALRRGFQQRP